MQLESHTLALIFKILFSNIFSGQFSNLCFQSFWFELIFIEFCRYSILAKRGRIGILVVGHISIKGSLVQFFYLKRYKYSKYYCCLLLSVLHLFLTASILILFHHHRNFQNM